MEIGRTVYDIATTDTLRLVDIPEGRHMPRSLTGVVDLLDKKIRLYAPAERQKIDVLKTLLHEIFHAISYEYKIAKLKDSNGDDDEDAISLLALGMSEVLETGLDDLKKYL